jgi:CxxC motif-containing protein (DUF1111 family)
MGKGRANSLLNGLSTPKGLKKSLIFALFAAVACADQSVDFAPTVPIDPVSPSGTIRQAPNATLPEPTPRLDSPIRGLTSEEAERFDEGDNLFDLPLRDADGLGPLLSENNCAACHVDGLRGPGLVQKMVVVEGDGETPAADQSALRFGNTVHPRVSGGATLPVRPPNDVRVKVTTRIGAAVLGRGYLEAVDDAQILAQENLQNARKLRGHVNWVIYHSEANTDTRFHTHKRGDRLIGRFGLKARIATLDDFTADAFQGDMGITSPLRPAEVPNPEGLLDDRKPGIDVGFESVNKRADYVRLLQIPPRGADSRDLVAAALFNETGCADCHVPSMKTRSDYPIRVLAGIDAPIYSDLLVHDMGKALADGVRDETASGSEWRTAPLIGMKWHRSFLHDGRARSVREAIEMHAGPGSEANSSIEKYRQLSSDQRTLLDAFTSAL